MRSCQREVCITVIKSRVPVARRMTGLTGGRELRRCMIRFTRAVVIRQVTAHTGRRQAVILSARMALVAACCDVRTCQGELRVTVIEACFPVGRRVTGLTSRRKPGRFVIRFTRAVVIRKVAINTLTGSPFKHPAHMALLTRCLDMRTRQREVCITVIKSRVPVARRVTGLTGGRELRRCMIRFRRAVVIRKVAINTLTRGPFKHPAHMALLTGCLDMCTRQREVCRLMIKPHVPRLRRVTRQTGCRDPDRFVIRFTRAVVIRKVAINTLTGSPFKHPAHMALLTRCLDMRTRQREVCITVIKSRVPVARRVTGLTGGRELRRCMIRFRRAVVILGDNQAH